MRFKEHVRLVCYLEIQTFNPLLILDSSKLKEFADDNFKSDESGRKFSKWVEDNVGKGEIARYEQFLLFHIVFKRHVQNYGLFGKGLNGLKKEAC